MTSYVGLLRGINLGKRQLKMEDLRTIASGLGFGQVSTYIASGNLIFSSDLGEAAVKEKLEDALGKHLGKPVPVMIRTAAEMAQAAKANPFADQPEKRVVAIFLDHAPPKDAGDQARNLTDERIALGEREIYVHFPSGQSRSKLAIPAAKDGTARNMNSVAKLAELAKETE